MVNPPETVRVLSGNGVFEIVWHEEGLRRYPFRMLRIACPCAGCVNEFTGERILDPDSVPEEIRPVGVDFTGNYALHIQWSDGHSTGIYTWDFLNHLGNTEEVLKTTELE